MIVVILVICMKYKRYDMIAYEENFYIKEGVIQSYYLSDL